VFDAFCEGKSLYFQELDRNLDRVRSETVVIDVDAVGSVFRPTETVAGDLGDHKFVVVNDTFVMLTTLPGEPEARLIRFDTNFEPIDDLTSDSSLARVGDENDGDRLLDMGFETGGGYLYAQFYDQPDGGTVTDWSAQLYQLDMNLSVVAEALVQPEEGTFMTGTSLVWVPAGEMGVREDRLHQCLCYHRQIHIQLIELGRPVSNRATVGLVIELSIEVAAPSLESHIQQPVAIVLVAHAGKTRVAGQIVDRLKVSIETD
jgi:hypothetical protein